MSAILGPVRQQVAPLRRMISARLRDAIESGLLAQGARLVEKELCTQLDVSRTSLREALRELESEGLITHRPNCGLVVARITRDEAENIYRVRGALEALAAEQFAERGQAADIDRLHRCLDAIVAARRGDDMRAITETKQAFYSCLCEGAANPVALDILRNLNARTSQLRRASLGDPARLHESTAEIREVVDCIARGDPRAAGAAARRHIERALRAALACTTFHDDDAS